MEILITMFVIALLTSLAAPRFAAVMPGAELRHTTMVLAADLRGARNDAIAKGRPLVISFDTEERHYRGGLRNAHTDWPERVEFEIVVPERMFNEQDKPEIWFYPDGSSSGGKILCSSSDRSYVVSVNWLAGWIAVQG